MSIVSPEALAELVGVMQWALRIALLVVFASAVRHKLVNFLEFTGVVGQYRLLPQALTTSAAVAVIALEVGAVLALLVTPVFGLLVAALALALYCVAIGVNLARGRKHINCGCGGNSEPLSVGLLARNTVMLILCLAFAAGSAVSPSGWLGWLAVGFSCAVLSLLYLATTQLLANRGIFRRLWLGEQTA